jgi:hypothetical protein
MSGTSSGANDKHDNKFHGIYSFEMLKTFSQPKIQSFINALANMCISLLDIKEV